MIVFLILHPHSAVWSCQHNCLLMDEGWVSFCLSLGWSSIVSVYVPRSLCPSLARSKVFPNQSASTSQPEVSGWREILRPNINRVHWLFFSIQSFLLIFGIFLTRACNSAMVLEWDRCHSVSSSVIFWRSPHSSLTVGPPSKLQRNESKFESRQGWAASSLLSVASHAESIIVLKDWRDLYTVDS